ncbi:MAG: glycosyltransferase family 39 protein [Anaerolineae bacterium]|nr:glycosyltransferase family 39 protein [Anaerolineae bacterium]
MTDSTTPPPHASRFADAPWMTIIVVVFAGLAVAYSLVTPLFEASDELWHYPMVKYVADHNFGLPVQQAGLTDAQAPWRQEGGQPPLYYFMAAAITRWIDTDDLHDIRRINPHADIGEIVPDGNVNMVAHNTNLESWPWSGAVLAMHLVRFLSIALSTGTVYLTYLLGRELFPNLRAIALMAAAFTAFNPMFIFISAVINNDNLSTLLATALLLLIVRLIKRADDPPDWRFYALLGVTAGAGMLAKFQIGFMLPIIALVLAGISLKHRNWRPLIIGGAISGGLTILIAGWWYARNYDLYGDATGINVFLDIVGRRAVPADLHQLWTERETFYMAFWGFFGGVNVPLNDDLYTQYNAIAGIAAVGALIGAGNTIIQRFSDRDNFTPAEWRLNLARAVTLLWAVVVFISLLTWTRQTWASQGRLWFSAIAALSILMAAGLNHWAHLATFARLGDLTTAKKQPITLAFAIMLTVPWFANGSLTALITTIYPAYHLDHDAVWKEFELEGSVIKDGALHPACFTAPESATETLCLAYRELSGAIQPGDYLRLAPTMTVKNTLTRDWSIFIHLVNADGVIEAQRDVYPGGGLLATTDLEPGETWNNLIAVLIPQGLYTPQTLDVYLGFYDLHTFDRMTAPAATAENRLWLGQVTLETPPGAVPNPVNVNFGDQLTLRGYEVSDRSLLPGEETTITLYWEARNATLDNYVVSVQIIDPDPARLTKAAQRDAPPDPPTPTWTSGAQIADVRTLTIFPDAPPGRYRLMVRVYPAGDPSSTLRVRGDSGAQSEDFVWLSWIQVE